MRSLSVFSVLLFAALVLGTIPAPAQDGPLARLFSIERKASQPERSERSVFGGPKRVDINLKTQKLRAYEGNRLVMQTRISSGRGGATPTGRYSAGPYKAQDHYSSLYQNAHMPWSVQVTGHIFIHGFASVPNYPASHGCIRVPVSGTNPARRFFKWVDVGTPIHIHY